MIPLKIKAYFIFFSLFCECFSLGINSKACDQFNGFDLIGWEFWQKKNYLSPPREERPSEGEDQYYNLTIYRQSNLNDTYDRLWWLFTCCARVLKFFWRRFLGLHWYIFSNTFFINMEWPTCVLSIQSKIPVWITENTNETTYSRISNLTRYTKIFTSLLPEFSVQFDLPPEFSVKLVALIRNRPLLQLST